MESKKAEKREIERLAEIRAKRRVESWGEQHKAGWFGGLIFLVWFGFAGLISTWLFWETGELSIVVPIAVTLLVGLLSWLVFRTYRTWREKRFRELYEENLLELKLKK